MLRKSVLIGFFVVGVFFCFLLAACAKPEEKRYEFSGKIVNVDRKAHLVSVAHEAVPGLMDSMTMPFRLSEKDQWAFDAMETGNAIQATLVVAGERSWLENPVISQERKDPSAKPGKVTEPLPGEEIQDFTLVNQDNKKISIHQYRGKALLLTFIYTRCPLPDYCPLMTHNFAQIDKGLREDAALAAKTHLLSITVDPEYDKPDVLRAYSLKHNSAPDFEHWEMATGSPEEIKRIATNFGLYYSTENKQIVHNLQTALIAPDGKFVKMYRGNDWQPAEIINDVQKLDLK
jgi:protein SCO1